MDEPKDQPAREEVKAEDSQGTPDAQRPETEAVASDSVKETPVADLSIDAAIFPSETKVSDAQPQMEIPGMEAKEGRHLCRVAYEHPWPVRFCHWLNAVSIFVLVSSGLRIFRAFPSFGPKIPQRNFVDVPRALTLGGWLGGALRWHFTLMWVFAGTGVLYLAYQFLSGHYNTALFTPKDIRGVWPMIRHYFFFGPKPPVTEQYNPLQKLAYTSTVLFGVASVVTGVVVYKPVQFSWLGWLMGGFHLARVWHFAAMCGFLAFIPGHLLMVALHRWNNFASMWTGWKKDPEYLSE